MTITKKLKLISNLKFIISVLILIIFFNCSSDNQDEKTSNTSITKLLAIDGIGSQLKIVELDPETGNLISQFLKFVPMQANVDFDFTYFDPTNELFIKRNVYQNGIGSQIIKVNIDSKEENIISTQVNSKIIATNDKLFGLNRTVDSNLLTIDLFEINPEDGTIIKAVEKFETLENAPDNDRAGISDLFYSNKTNEILIPRRIEFIAGATDQLIKTNADTGAKKIVPINHYQAITVGNKGRVFAINHSYNETTQQYSNYEIIEIDIQTGKEISTIKEFEYFGIDLEFLFLSSSNELIIDLGLELKKINLDTKVESIINNNAGYYSFRSINIYK